MNTEMTVYGISSKDTINVNNRLNNGVNDEQSDSDSSNASNISINNNILNDSNWSPNNSNSNDVNDSFTNPDEALQPIERLEKYSSSEIIFHRQVVARSVLETLNDVQQNDIQRVMAVISRLASDTEPSIRAELVEQLPHISAYCVNQIVNFPNLVPHYILPILEQFLTDSNSQVRKMTQNAFVLMLEQGLIKNDFLENQICPLLIQLTDFSNLDDYRMEAVGMMSKIVRFMGRELTEKLLLNSFSRLCSDVSFHVRRVCAAHFGDFCTVVGQDLTENILLPYFRRLCKDSIWGVRKSCADVFVPISLVVSNKVRHEILSPVFVSLLCDGSRWVKTAAFQTLGPFISTFADASKTGLYYSDNGTVVIEDHTSNDSGFSGGSESNVESPTEIDDDIEEVSLLQHNFDDLALTNTSQQNHMTDNNKEIDCNDQFSQFLYWKIPISDLSFDSELNREFDVSGNSGDIIESVIDSTNNITNIEVSRSEEDIFNSDD
jgi:serine/threonine-protein phosphatase 4 regulatory subunit 1